MKLDQIVVAIIIGFLAALIAVSAQADDWTNKGNVYRNGVSIGSMYDVKMLEPGMTSEQAVSEIKQTYKELEIQRIKEQNQEQRAKKRAVEEAVAKAFAEAEVVRIETEGKAPALDSVSVEKVAEIDAGLEYFFAHNFKGTPEQAEEMIEFFAQPMTLAETTALVQQVYGSDITQDDVKFALENGSATDIRGATTWAIKYLTGTLDL